METTEQTTAMEPVSVSAEILNSANSRRAFLGTLAAGAAAATTLATVPSSVFAATGKLKYAGASVPASDAHILNYALTLEHLEAQFYIEGVSRFGNHGFATRVFKTLRYDEISHVNALTAAIKSVGYVPVGKAAMYHFSSAMTSLHAFLTTSKALENTGVHAYLGQAPNIKTTSILLTAASIVTVEARHAGAISALLQQNPTQGPFDQGFTEKQVLAIAGKYIG